MRFRSQRERCGPFGVGSGQPRLALPAVRVAKAPVVGDNHVRCFLGDSAGGDAGAGSIKAIAFRALESPLGPALLQTAGLPLHVAGRLQIDRWNGREGVQFIIEAAPPAAGCGCAPFRAASSTEARSGWETVG